MSTSVGELLLVNIKTKEIEGVLQMSFVNGIVDGLDNSTLICTNDGLYRIKNQDIVYTWKKSGGLSGNQVFHALENENGVYAATNKGLNKLQKVIHGNFEKSIDFSIDEVVVNNQPIKFNDNNIDLDSDQNNIRISFHLKDYESGGDIQYFTRLSPSQENWEMSEKGSVTFLGLTSEDHVLELKARRFNGQEIIYPSEIIISIQPPWWKNTWVYILTGVAIFLGIFFYNKKQQKIRQDKFFKEKEIDKRISDLQLSALRSQMNPHFIFNALGAIQFFVQTKETELADEYLSQFALLMRMYLEASKEPLISLDDEIKLLRLYASIEEMRFDRLFTTSFEIDPKLDRMDSKLPSVLIQPFLENAILHGLQPRNNAGGLLNVSFRLNGEDLVVKITDNGIGKNAAILSKRHLHRSRGLENIQARMQTMKMASDQNISFVEKIPHPENSKFPGHEVIITFENV